MMLTIPFNGEPCYNCGRPVFQLSVSVNVIHEKRAYRANCTLPCGCLHAMTELRLEARADVGDRQRVSA